MKKYTVIYGNSLPFKEIKKIPSNILQTIRNQIEEKLTHSPEIFGKPLRNSLYGYRRLRIGKYRIIYRITPSAIVEVMFIGKKPKVYEHFLRKF